MADKEFWEWCGFEYIPYEHLGTRKDRSVLHPQGITVISTQQEYWIYPDGSKHKIPPPTDLNNLFEYAVPKLECISLVTRRAPSIPNFVPDGYRAFVSIGALGYSYEDKDPAQALYKAIKQVIS